MSSIYELTNDYLKVMELIEEGEIDKETLDTTLDCINYEIEEKAENYAKIIKNIESEINGFKAEEDRLSKKRKTLETNIKNLKDNLFNTMKLTGKEKFKTDLFSFNIQKNPPSLKILDENRVPNDFKIPQPDLIDKKAIIAEIKTGKEFDWAILEQGESLRIR